MQPFARGALPWHGLLLARGARRALSAKPSFKIAPSYDPRHRIAGMPEIIEHYGRRVFAAISAALVGGSGAALMSFGPTTGIVTFGALSAGFLVLGLADIRQSSHSILRNFPVLGHVRYMLEGIRPEIRQYFVESDQEAAPFTREQRALVYQRAKGDVDASPFGTRRNVYEDGYEFIQHSIYPAKRAAAPPRIVFGQGQCAQPYSASLLNISAMSFGAISEAAVRALNMAAKQGDFAHNTGEGGVSPYHLSAGAAVTWNIGTGYFSARNDDGTFSRDRFAALATGRPEIRMIEVKLSQGAKPGHGGLLPAAKLTPAIAATRGVPLGKDCHSPAQHSAFRGPKGLIRFVKELRDLSGGKPVGIKLCVGKPEELAAIIAAGLELGSLPDFITVDGGEGGTGAAPSEFVNHVGTPLVDALAVTHRLLVGAGVRDQVRVTASGKITSGFSMFRALALGADTCNSARGMMFALGCVQSLKCHSNKCPTGIATQDERLQYGLVVPDKADRVANFHRKTVDACLDLVAASGHQHPKELSSDMVIVRQGGHSALSYADIYPPLDSGVLLRGGGDPTIQKIWSKGYSVMKAET